MRLALYAFLLALFLPASSADAFQRNSGGLSFDCSSGDAADGQCVCQPPASSIDCQNMKKFCAGEIICGWGISNCHCVQKPAFKGFVKQGKFVKGERGVVLDPGRGQGRPSRGTNVVAPLGGGILEQSPGFTPQAPAATGAPVGGGRAPPGQIR